MANPNLSTAEIEPLVQRALNDDDYLAALVAEMDPRPGNEGGAYTSFLTLEETGRRNPERLYGYWNFLAGLLRMDHTFAKYRAIHLLAAIIPADQDHRFDELFDDYFGLLLAPKITLAAHCAAMAGRIARARPDLQEKITGRLLNIEGNSPLGNQSDLILAYAIESCSEYLDTYAHQDQILAFVHRQMDSHSPKTRKAAAAFFKRMTGGAQSGVKKTS